MTAIKPRLVPKMLYGTAWKKDRTQILVHQAISAGFRAIDTAAQPKHYQEDLVGAGIRDAMRTTPSLTRADLYIQTKFTSLGGQDVTRLPYDPAASLEDQVHQSIASSLHNLRHQDAQPPTSQTDGDDAYIDCLVLHSPLPKLSQTLQIWRALESYVPHRIRSLGISNIYQPSTLEALHRETTIKPSVVQNRFCRETDYGNEIRAFCDAAGIQFQSFWTLTANPDLLASEPVEKLALATETEGAVALYYLVMGVGNVSILNGTTSEKRMKEDLRGLEMIENWTASNVEAARTLQVQFESLLH